MIYLIRRFASAYMDALIVVGLIVMYRAVISISREIPLYDIESPDADYWLLLQIIVMFIYYLICEFLFKRTIGKMIFRFQISGFISRMGIKRFWQVVKRTLSRFIPFEPFSILLSEERVMWHDKISKTRVIDSRQL